MFLFFLFNTFFFKSGTFHRVVELPFESCLTHLISPSSLSLGCKQSKKCSNPNLKRFNCSIAFIAIAQHALTASSLPQTRTSLANFRLEHTLFVRFSQACLIKKEKPCFSTGNKFSKHAAKSCLEKTFIQSLQSTRCPKSHNFFKIQFMQTWHDWTFLTTK